MGRSLPMPPPGFDELSAEEKVQYVEQLWDRIGATPDDVPLPGWHRQLVSDRLADYRTGAGAERPWSDVRDELLVALAGGRKRHSR
jgi:putative addiction module component (TIGR02574 family)